MISGEASGARRCGRRPVLTAVGTILLAAWAAGCAGSLPASPSVGTAATAAPTPTAVSPTPSDPTSASAAPSEVPGLGVPPEAVLDGLEGSEPIPGSLGTFTWDGLTSDGPWIVPPDGGTAGTGQRLSVAFAPPLPPSSWRARWAPVTGSEAGEPRAAGEGAGAGIVVAAPDVAGTWSLLVEASFGNGRNATWFWRVEVLP